MILTCLNHVKIILLLVHTCFFILKYDDGFVSVIEWSHENRHDVVVVVAMFISSILYSLLFSLFWFIMCMISSYMFHDKSDDRLCCYRDYSLFSQITERERESDRKKKKIEKLLS